MTYNEYAQVLEAKNPKTGRALHAGRLQRHRLERRGHGHAAGRHLGQHREARVRPGLPGHDGQVPRRPRSRAGSTAATTPRSASTSCVAKGSKLGKSHQLWQMNEINKLIWPSPDGIGIDRPGGLGPDGRDLAQHQERRGQDGASPRTRRRAPTPATSTPPPWRCSSEADVDVEGTDFEPDRGRAQGGRRLAGRGRSVPGTRAPAPAGATRRRTRGAR